jgi:hypothetical protein
MTIKKYRYMKMLRWMLVVASVLLTESFYPVFAKSKKTTMNVASFNIRLNTTKDSTDAWPYRAQMVTDLIQYHEFDVFGVQEALPEQMEYLSQMTEYNHVGRGRDDGEEAGEHSAAFSAKTASACSTTVISGSVRLPIYRRKDGMLRAATASALGSS